ncbi:TonB-dependent receptor [Marinimicrobium alkaliphilum]|uniref:TonB-dependent receptor n=1 Tax=Marinimicrobium alkaliphilum TaxID=2202654 RepID=UPI000DB9BBB1|nr:TonB-dependent receptor [Marinimicrobium alkaliphilum]
MNKNSSFKKKLIATAISSYALAGFSGAAMAQDEGAILEEVVVTGILGSLNRAMDIKRDSQGVVDAIAAEDIGKFPDTNLAESLQRITGVSIDRANGEGSRVTVRGFGADYNLVTLNGRQMPTSALEETSAAATRSFDFANLAAEGVSGVEVYKTSRASIPTGGIGATINILTNRPLDNPGLSASFGLKGVIDESTSRGADITPEVSGIYSNTFADDTFGISISGSYQERESGSRVATTAAGWHTFTGDQDDTNSWGGISQDPNLHVNRPGVDDLYSVPQQLAYAFHEVQRTRTNGQLALQYRPVNNVTATVDYTYSKLDVKQQFQDVSAWFNFGPSTGVWTDGPISSPLIYAEQTENPADLAMGAGNFARINENHSMGINVEWLVNDRLTLELDAHSSDAESRPNSPYGSHNAFGVATWVRNETIADFTADFPILQVVYPEGQDGIEPNDILVAGSSFRNSMMRSEIDQIHLSGKLEFDGGHSIDFGVMHTDVHNRSAYANVQREEWGGVGTPDDIDADFWTRETIADRFNIPGSDSPLLHNEYYSFDFDELVRRATDMYPEPGITPAGDCGTWYCASSDYANQTDRYVREDTFSAYFQFNMDFDVYNMPVNVATGMRYESTNVTSTAAVPVFDRVVWASANEFGLIGTGEQDYTELTGGYNKLMPSIDVSVEVIEDVLVRASLSESLARPSYSAIQGGTSVAQNARINGGTASRGNPDLLPYESMNLDLSAEWYYDFASYVSAGWFRKDVKNFIGSTILEEQLFDLAHPAQGPRYEEAVAAVGNDANDIRDYIFENYGDTEFVDGNRIIGIPGEDDPIIFDVTVPINERDAVVYGWEFAVQHMFGDTGFGVIANLTLVESGTDFDDLSLDEQYPLFGLSDSANLIGFYDRDGLQARLAYNWRDKFIAAGAHGTGYPNPVYVEAYGQFDLSLSYDVTPQLTVFAEGINISDEYMRQHSRSKEQVMNVTQLGPRYNLGVRYTF